MEHDSFFDKLDALKAFRELDSTRGGHSEIPRGSSPQGGRAHVGWGPLGVAKHLDEKSGPSLEPRTWEQSRSSWKENSRSYYNLLGPLRETF